MYVFGGGASVGNLVIGVIGHIYIVGCGCPVPCEVGIFFRFLFM